MPLAELARFTLVDEELNDQNWSGADLRGQDLRGAVFTNCDFSGANFEGADLADAAFDECQFAGANPERAASLEGTELLVEGLTVEQRAACAARGAAMVDADDEEGA